METSKVGKKPRWGDGDNDASTEGPYNKRRIHRSARQSSPPQNHFLPNPPGTRPSGHKWSRIPRPDPFPGHHRERGVSNHYLNASNESCRARPPNTLATKIADTINTARASGASNKDIRDLAAKELISLGPSIKTDFEAIISAEGYNCHWRIPSDKHTRMCTLLDNPSTAQNSNDRNLYQWAKKSFELRENGRVLYRSPEKGYDDFRRVIWPTEVSDVIARVHLKNLHTGRDKTWVELDKRFYGLNKSEVMWVIDHCAYCLANKATATKAPLEPIISNQIFERVQIDLVDMRHEPSGRYKWVFHLKDHFAKFSFLFPLVSKHRYTTNLICIIVKEYF